MLEWNSVASVENLNGQFVSVDEEAIVQAINAAVDNQLSWPIPQLFDASGDLSYPYPICLRNIFIFPGFL